MAEQTLPRVFKVGDDVIPEDDGNRSMTNEQVRDALKMAYPEIAYASIVEVRHPDQIVVEFRAKAGRKG